MRFAALNPSPPGRTSGGKGAGSEDFLRAFRVTLTRSSLAAPIWRRCVISILVDSGMGAMALAVRVVNAACRT